MAPKKMSLHEKLKLSSPPPLELVPSPSPSPSPEISPYPEPGTPYLDHPTNASNATVSPYPAPRLAVAITMTASGDVADFDEAKSGELEGRLAAVVEVDASAVSLAVSAASVQLSSRGSMRYIVVATVQGTYATIIFVHTQRREPRHLVATASSNAMSENAYTMAKKNIQKS